MRELAARYGCGKTQDYSMLKNKQKSSNLTRVVSRRTQISVSTRSQRKSPNGELNKLLYVRIQLALRKNIVPDCPTLMDITLPHTLTVKLIHT